MHLKSFKHISILVIGVLLILPSSIFGSPEKQAAGYSASVIKVIDGDSIKINHDGQFGIVRLYGIDSPEWKQPYSRKAKLYLEKLILHKDIQVKALYMDKYSRIVALVYFQGNLVNKLLVEKGLAWVHIYYCHMQMCEGWKRLEQHAKTKRIGFWREKNPIPPWVWKRIHKN